MRSLLGQYRRLFRSFVIRKEWVSVPFDFAFSAMAAQSDEAPARWRHPLLKWLDGVERGWAVPLMLAVFSALWLAFLCFAYLGSDLHPDVLETWTLGRAFAWGNSKHPPLMGWITGVWTSVFPLTDWSLQLMAMVNGAFALWCVDLISRHFVKGDKRIIVLLLLMLLPTYQFHAQRFNANSVLLAIWPISTYCFLRSFESHRFIWASAAGATAAVAMLGKYYSIFLIVSFLFAAICHPLRRNYFSSSAPLVSVAAGLVVLGPHLNWLAATGAEPFNYALAHAGLNFAQAFGEALFFLLGMAATLAVPVATFVMIAGYRLKQLPKDLTNINSDLRLLSLIAAGTIVFPMVTAIALGTDMPSLWGEQGLFLLVVLLVCSTGYPIERFYAVNVAVMVLGFASIAVLFAAPIHAVYRNIYAYEEGRSFYRLAAQELTRQWHTHADVPLSVVSGDEALAFATAFYSPDHPNYAIIDIWGLPSVSTIKSGWATLCFEESAHCIDWMRKISSGRTQFIESQFVVQSHLLGVPGASRRVILWIVPPPRS